LGCRPTKHPKGMRHREVMRQKIPARGRRVVLAWFKSARPDHSTSYAVLLHALNTRLGEIRAAEISAEKWAIVRAERRRNREH